VVFNIVTFFYIQLEFNFYDLESPIRLELDFVIISSILDLLAFKFKIFDQVNH
jgi:hypothetical protein